MFLPSSCFACFSVLIKLPLNLVMEMGTFRLAVWNAVMLLPKTSSLLTILISPMDGSLITLIYTPTPPHPTSSLFPFTPLHDLLPTCDIYNSFIYYEMEKRLPHIKMCQIFVLHNNILNNRFVNFIPVRTILSTGSLNWSWNEAESFWFHPTLIWLYLKECQFYNKILFIYL